MSPFLFAQEMTKQLGTTLLGLCRVWFKDNEVHNRYEGSRKREQTGFDTLIVVSKGMLCLFVDEGIHGIPVAMWFVGEDKVKMSEPYVKTKYTKKLTEEECLELFKAAFKQREMVLRPKRVEPVGVDKQ